MNILSGQTEQTRFRNQDTLLKSGNMSGGGANEDWLRASNDTYLMRNNLTHSREES